MMNYDETVLFLGEWGRFQQLVFFLLCICVFPAGFGAFSLVFLADVPSHHCLVPEVNLTEGWQQAIIPVKVMTIQEDQDVALLPCFLIIKCSTVQVTFTLCVYNNNSVT